MHLKTFFFLGHSLLQKPSPLLCEECLDPSLPCLGRGSCSSDCAY